MCAAALNSRGCVYRCMASNSIQYFLVEGKSAFFLCRNENLSFLYELFVTVSLFINACAAIDIVVYMSY